MGCWGSNPWDSDSAADWSYEAFAVTSEMVHKELAAVSTGAKQFSHSTYMALWTLGQIGRNYVYNIDTLDQDKKLALELLDDYGSEWAFGFGDSADRDQVSAHLAAIRAKITAPQSAGLIGRLNAFVPPF